MLRNGKWNESLITLVKHIISNVKTKISKIHPVRAHTNIEKVEIEVVLLQVYDTNSQLT